MRLTISTTGAATTVLRGSTCRPEPVPSHGMQSPAWPLLDPLGDEHGRSDGVERRYRAPVHVVALEVEIRIPHSQSLKDRRQVVRSLVEGARQRFGVSAAEVGGQETWQRATLGFAVVTSEVRLADEVVDSIDRFLWSRAEIEVVSSELRWID